MTCSRETSVAITLRIVLVENLRRIAQRVVDSRAGRQSADAVADRLLGAGGREDEPAAAVLPPHGGEIYSDSLLDQLVHRLRDQDPSIGPASTAGPAAHRPSIARLAVGRARAKGRITRAQQVTAATISQASLIA